MRLGGRLSAASEILADIEARRRPVADALKDWGLSHRFAGSGDRAAIGNIVYDVLRRKRSLAWRVRSEEPRVLAIGALLDSLAISPDELAKALDGDRFAPPLPSADALSGLQDRDLARAPDAVRADVHDWVAPHLEASLGDGWVDEARALAERPPLDMRVNVLKASREKVADRLSPFHASPTPLAPHGLRIDPVAGDGRHPNVQVEAAFQKGWFEIQDEGSQLVALLAGARPGSQVLDYCAGAGGKTLALAAAMENTGQIHAYDSDRQRLAPIHERLKRADVRNVQVHSPRDDLSGFVGAMELVLVDAPCTGTGTWRRRPDAKWRLTAAAIDKRLAEQDRALHQASTFVRPGGRLVYVTCSLLAAENADRITAFLADHPAFVVSDAEQAWPADHAERSAFLARPVGGGVALTLTPRLTGTDGFFFAALERR